MADRDGRDLTASAGSTVGILDCEVRAQRFSAFVLPSRALREGLSPGNHARVVLGVGDADPSNDVVHASAAGGFFRRPSAPTAESLFVEIVERRGARYLGRIVNVPMLKFARHGQHLEFGPEHVCGWEP